jgi:DNA invertase Pin-like site-specific DNA recombinase
MDWSRPVSAEVAAKRAGGRRHYNAIRREKAQARREQLIKLVLRYGHERGARARIAERLGVSRRTLGRDLAAIRVKRARPRCQTCGQVLSS